MATFYNTACRVDAKMALFQPELQRSIIDDGLNYYTPKDNDEKLLLPHSIMNENVAINYRTIYNGYPSFIKCDEKGNEYWILRISSSLSNKLNSIKSIYLEGKYDTLVVLASGKSDLELVKKADLSICLSTAQDYVKDECDK